MKLYYHKTDGGAEYLCLQNVKQYYGIEGGDEEGAMPTAIIRTDGDEIEIYTERLKENSIKLNVNQGR